MCKTCQSLFGNDPDKAVGKFSDFFRNMLKIGTGRDKKSIPVIEGVTDKDNHEYVIKPGGEADLKEPYIEQTEEGNLVAIYSANKKGHEEWAKHKLSQKVDIKGKELFKKVISENPGPLYLKMELVVMGNLSIAFLKSAFNLIGVFNSELALSADFDTLREILKSLDTEKSIKLFSCRRVVHLPYDDHSLFAHQLYVISKADSVYAVLRLFGGVTFSMCLSEQYSGEPFSYMYIVDPMQPSSRISDDKYYPKLAKLLPVSYEEHTGVREPNFRKNILIGYELFRLKLKSYKLLRSLLSKAIDNLNSQLLFEIYRIILPSINEIIFQKTRQK